MSRVRVHEDLKGGVVIHGHFESYNRGIAALHAFRNSHIPRELEGRIAFDGEPWAKFLHFCLLEANVALREARAAGQGAAK